MTPIRVTTTFKAFFLDFFCIPEYVHSDFVKKNSYFYKKSPNYNREYLINYS